MDMKSSLTPESFCLAFLTALGKKGENVIDVRSSETTRGFSAVLKSLDDQIELLMAKGSKGAALSVLKTRSYLSPSPIGSFDRFETCLRGLQTSAVGSLNPEFKDMQSEITEPFASADFENYDVILRNLASTAADRYLAAVTSRAA